MNPFWGAFLGAFLALCANAALRFWQYRRDIWLRHGERFCDVAQTFADLATDYWLKPGGPKGASNVPGPLAGAEARLLALQSKLDGIWEIASVRLPKGARKRVVQNLNALTEAATGGNFQVRARAVDGNRARQSQLSCAEVVTGFWAEAGQALTLLGTALFVFQSRATWITVALISVAALVATHWTEILALFQPLLPQAPQATTP